MRNYNLRAIALGFFTDLATTKLFVLALVVVLLDPGSSSTSLADNVNQVALDFVGLTCGLFFTGLGGFVAARLAPRRPLQHAGIVGVLSTLTALASYGLAPAEVTLPLYDLGLLLTLPVALVGAHFATRYGKTNYLPAA